MAESKEIKVKSFRIDNETAQKFKDIADGLGTNQQDTMQLLINAYCMQEQKMALNDYKADLDKFENYTTALLQMFTTALQSNKNARELVRTEFEASLKSKDTIIQELQDKLANAKTVKEDATTKAKELEEENANLKGENAKLLKRIEEKDELNKALRVADAEYKKQSDQLEESIKANAELKAEISTLQVQIDALKSQLADKEISITNLEKQAQIDVKMATLEVKEECQAKIDEYQQKYKVLLEQMNKADNVDK
jgi:chromosome segregation ATPase